jgi:hypothetical protein
VDGVRHDVDLRVAVRIYVNSEMTCGTVCLAVEGSREFLRTILDWLFA